MKLAVVLVLLVAAAVKAGPAAPRKYGRYVFFPGGDGKLHLVDTQLKVPQQKVDVSEVTFQLYTQQNPDNYQRLIAGDVSSLGNFSPSRVTKFVTHGYTSNAGNFVDFKDAYLATGDYNVILVDWSGPAGGLYNVAKDNTVQVGGFLAELADFLVANGANPSNIHFIGHSLGAHVSGCAGGRTGAYIGKIIGLDPAGVLYGGEDLLDRLDSSDAAVVEVVHTNGGLLGWFDPMGTADFYPNGGDWQPGCDFDITGSCSHSRANAYLVESIYSNNFVAHACGSWTDFQDGLCSGGATALMGEKPSPSPSGVYFLGVSDSSPYALG